MRGKRGGCGGHFLGVRLIPACAGKTPTLTVCSVSQRAHPRVCGENEALGCCLDWERGSSPRVRGKLTREAVRREGRRLIPACAGKTTKPTLLLLTRRAHPRVCGENREIVPCCTPSAGSSPRVRGKPFLEIKVKPMSGLIPACAGKTRSRACQPACTGAHPRVCGENLFKVS